MTPGFAAQDALARMSEAELQATLVKLAGPIVRELAKRGCGVTLDAPAELAASAPNIETLFRFLPG